MREEVRRKGIGGLCFRWLMLARCNHEGILPQMLGKVEELLSRGRGTVGGLAERDCWEHADRPSAAGMRDGDWERERD